MSKSNNRLAAILLRSCVNCTEARSMDPNQQGDNAVIRVAVNIPPNNGPMGWSIPDPTSGGRRHHRTLDVDIDHMLLLDDAQSPTFPCLVRDDRGGVRQLHQRVDADLPDGPADLTGAIEPSSDVATIKSKNKETQLQPLMRRQGGDETTTAAMTTVTETSTAAAATATATTTRTTTTTMTMTMEEVGRDALADWSARSNHGPLRHAGTDRGGAVRAFSSAVTPPPPPAASIKGFGGGGRSSTGPSPSGGQPLTVA
jgi:hypothetical protein